MINLFDTHCHLYSKRLASQLDNIINSNSIVKYFVIPGINLTTSLKAIEIAQNYKNVFVAVGLHPQDINANWESELIELKKLINYPQVIAVGEVGLDNSDSLNSYQSLTLQQQVLSLQIKIATNSQKSLILHSRDTSKELTYTLDQNWNSNLCYRTVLHCCEPDFNLLNFALKKQIFIGVDGDVTYYLEKQQFIKSVPIDMLVIETDAPYLLPEPLKSQKLYPNKPENLIYTITKIAEIYNIEIESISKITTHNALKLFNLAK